MNDGTRTRFGLQSQCKGSTLRPRSQWWSRRESNSHRVLKRHMLYLRAAGPRWRGIRDLNPVSLRDRQTSYPMDQYPKWCSRPDLNRRPQPSEGCALDPSELREREMVYPGGLEPPTFGFVDRHSNPVELWVHEWGAANPCVSRERHPRLVISRTGCQRGGRSPKSGA